MQKIIETVSFLSMVIGCAGIGGDHMIISGIMAIGGLAVIGLIAVYEKKPCVNNQPKQTHKAKTK